MNKYCRAVNETFTPNTSPHQILSKSMLQQDATHLFFYFQVKGHIDANAKEGTVDPRNQVLTCPCALTLDYLPSLIDGHTPTAIHTPTIQDSVLLV